VKQYFFISGLPRSGNTLLASILNENENILATGQSIFPSIFYDLQTITQENDVYKNYPQDERFENFYKNLFNNFFTNDNEKYIVQRGEFITPINLQNLFNYCPNKIKIVILVRNVVDVLKSFINHSHTYKNYYLNKFKTNDEKAIFLMEEHGYIKLILDSIKILIDNDEIKNFLIVDYDKFVCNPKEYLQKIYEYYEIKYFKHDLNNIVQLGGYKDYLYDHNLHEIKKNIFKNTYNVKLSKELDDKYQKYNYWKNII
jgi:hypothetical protein